jgi:hypothetical protein
MGSVQTLGFGFDSSLSRSVSSFVDLTSSGWLFCLFRNRKAMLFARVVNGAGRGGTDAFERGGFAGAACVWQVVSKGARHVICSRYGAQGSTVRHKHDAVASVVVVCWRSPMMWMFQGCPVVCPACRDA